MNRQYTISARGKAAAIPIQMFMRRNFSDIPVAQIDSFFGFTTDKSTLYGGRIYGGTELSAYDLKSMYEMGIGLRLPLTNHHATPEEYTANLPLFKKHHRPGNSIIVTNDNLARWIRRDFPEYRLEASVIKNIDSLAKIEKAAGLYDSIILPMSANEDDAFLASIGDKARITLFANAGCALTCPSKICYPSISKANKAGDRSLFSCSQKLKYRELLGMQDFDLDHLEGLGFHRFKLLRARDGNLTGA
ncbi:MAG: hypothetical protein KA760_00815 [Steroidobacteraceae bacterium]|jgi:hypothetical protein|nr:hypothetical protein [Steroidobacteraceae bacterium]MBP9129210.1 hypothetical protein [Steroidobacteraceae bacterium]